MSDPTPLTATQLAALPPGSAVRCTTEHGRHTLLAIKLPGYGLSANTWATTDGKTYPSGFAIADTNPVLLLPASNDAAPGTSRERSAHDAGGGADEGLRGALVELAGTGTGTGTNAYVICELLAAHPAPEADVAALAVDDVKMLRETLARAQAAFARRAEQAAGADIDRVQGLIDQLDVHRPLSADGKHGDRHTATCGCESSSDEWSSW